LAVLIYHYDCDISLKKPPSLWVPFFVATGWGFGFASLPAKSLSRFTENYDGQHSQQYVSIFLVVGIQSKSFARNGNSFPHDVAAANFAGETQCNLVDFLKGSPYRQVGVATNHRAHGA